MTESTKFNVLISGANTPIGHDIGRRLVAQGHIVTGIADGRDGASRLREDGLLPILVDPTRTGEILGMMKMANTDMVLHLSPLTRYGVPFGNIQYDTEALIASTKALVEASHAHGVKFFLHTSSVLVYGDVGEADESTAFIRANHPLVDATRQTEKLVRDASLPASMVRVGHMYDAHTATLRDLIDTVKLGRPIYTGKSPQRASWVHVDDVIQAMLLVIKSQPLGESFNIADDTPATPADFVAYLGDELGLKGRGSMVPFFERPRQYKSTAPLLEMGVQASNAKAKSMLAWQAKYGDYRRGIDQTLLTLRAEPIKK